VVDALVKPRHHSGEPDDLRSGADDGHYFHPDMLLSARGSGCWVSCLPLPNAGI
jgi:hypothetical protein